MDFNAKTSSLVDAPITDTLNGLHDGIIAMNSDNEEKNSAIVDEKLATLDEKFSTVLEKSQHKGSEKSRAKTSFASCNGKGKRRKRRKISQK